MSDIGHELSNHSGSFDGYCLGAIIPVIHLRSHLVLTPTEPEEIFRGVATGLLGRVNFSGFFFALNYGVVPLRLPAIIRQRSGRLVQSPKNLAKVNILPRNVSANRHRKRIDHRLD